MKIKITTAETDQTEIGKVTVNQVYSLDATEEFEDYIKGFDDESIIDAADSLDFIYIDEEEIAKNIAIKLRNLELVDLGVEEVYITLGPSDMISSVEEARNKVKNVEVEVQVDFTFSLDYLANEHIEKAVFGAILSQNSNLKISDQ